MTEPEYIDYFEGLARKNVLIGHNAEQCRFFYNEDDGLTALRESLRNKLHYPALVLDAYADSVFAEHDNPRLRVTGGISILVRTDSRDRESQRIGRQHAQGIARSILQRLRFDCRTPSGALFLRKIQLNLDFEGEPTPVLDGTIGWAYGIVMTMPTNMAVQVDDWSDL